MTASEVLTVYVEGAGTPYSVGYNGGSSGYDGAGSSGGASDIRRGAAALADRLVTAAAGATNLQLPSWLATGVYVVRTGASALRLTVE